MEKYLTLFLTHRGQFHQQNILATAPEELEITILKDATKEEVLQQLPGMDFLVTEREDLIDAELIAAGRKLRLIQRLGSQTWDIDLAAAKKAGIPVCYWPDQSVINVAEHALMLTLNLVKKMRELSATIDVAGWTSTPRLSDEDTFAYNWTGQKEIGTLRQKQIGILGLGEIGRELATRLKGFDCQLLYHKRRRLPLAAEKEIGITYLSWEELTHRSDVIYGLLPFSDAGSQSFNASFFARMKPGSYFVFCGGSGLVDETDLIDALRSGHLAGAALDTYTYEPLPLDSPLLALHRDPAVNLVLTPHIAGGTLGRGHLQDYSNLMRRLAGEDLLYRVA